MKKFHTVCACLLLLSGIALAQTAKPAEPRTVSQVLDRSVTNVENEFVPAADAMPEDKYSFAPTNGEFKGVRTFGDQVKHVAAVNYILAAAILGEKPPVDTGEESGPASVKSKADIMKYLKDSFVYLHKAAVKRQRKEPGCAREKSLRRRQCDPAGTGLRGCGPLLRPLRADGRIPAHERHYSARQPHVKGTSRRRPL